MSVNFHIKFLCWVVTVHYLSMIDQTFFMLVLLITVILVMIQVSHMNLKMISNQLYHYFGMTHLSHVSILFWWKHLVPLFNKMFNYTNSCLLFQFCLTSFKKMAVKKTANESVSETCYSYFGKKLHLWFVFFYLLHLT